jgi:hypothetical protein
MFWFACDTVTTKVITDHVGIYVYKGINVTCQMVVVDETGCLGVLGNPSCTLSDTCINIMNIRRRGKSGSAVTGVGASTVCWKNRQTIERNWWITDQKKRDPLAWGSLIMHILSIFAK